MSNIVKKSSDASVTVSAELCLYHGTDTCSAEIIIASGISELYAKDYGGGSDGTFWATKNEHSAWFFSQSCPNIKGGEPTVLKIWIKEKLIDILASGDSPRLVEIIETETFQFLPGGFDALNDAIVRIEQSPSQISIEFDA